jgi:undecaprenyl-diphosphatase
LQTQDHANLAPLRTGPEKTASASFVEENSGITVDVILLLKALLLGVIEGLTEFLPISSTGHLILASAWLEFNRPEAKTFEVVIQLGAILSVCWHFRERLSTVALTLTREASSRRFAVRLLVAFLPAAVLGLLLHGFIKQVLFSPLIVAWALLIGGVVILMIERWAPPPRVQTIDEISFGDALKIGFAQSLALIPGVSRSGATIMGAMLLGVSRSCATEFSFFLAIPVMFAATVFDVYKSWHELSLGALPMFAVGFVFAFLSALLTIRFLLRFVASNSFVPFAWYRIGFGALLLWFLSGSTLTT